jgi:hypothetical protein
MIARDTGGAMCHQPIICPGIFKFILARAEDVVDSAEDGSIAAVPSVVESAVKGFVVRFVVYVVETSLTSLVVLEQISVTRLDVFGAVALSSLFEDCWWEKILPDVGGPGATVDVGAPVGPNDDVSTVGWSVVATTGGKVGCPVGANDGVSTVGWSVVATTDGEVVGPVGVNDAVSTIGWSVVATTGGEVGADEPNGTVWLLEKKNELLEYRADRSLLLLNVVPMKKSRMYSSGCILIYCRGNAPGSIKGS